MKKQVIYWVLGLALACLGVSGTTTARAATTASTDATVNIGGVTVKREFLNINTYYRAQSAVKAEVTYYKVAKADSQYTKTITLPKGTVVAGDFIPKHHLANGKWGLELAVENSQLNYNLTKSGLKKGYLASGIVSYATSSFKKVKAPAYMPTYSSGDLYLGGAKATKQRDDQVKQIVRITTNGYVELMHRNTKATSDDAFAGKPFSQAKISKTQVKGATRYLYLNAKMTGLKTTKVGKKGAYQYRLAVKNLHQPVNLSYYDDDRGEVYNFDSLYAIGGVTYYTPICFGSDIED